jgi:hypothetical protein
VVNSRCLGLNTAQHRLELSSRTSIKASLLKDQAKTIRRKEIKNLLAVVLAGAFALVCVSFAAAADTGSGGTGQTVNKKKKRLPKRSPRSRPTLWFPPAILASLNL